MAPRVYLTGRVCLELGDILVDETQLAGGQGRHVLSILAIERRPVTVAELIAQLWETDAPPSADTTLRAVVSRLRKALAPPGSPPAGTIIGTLGCYELQLAPGTWVDVLAAAELIHDAETAQRQGNARDCFVNATVCRKIASRPFLPGRQGSWVLAQRSRMQATRVRTLDCIAWSRIELGEFEQAAADATEALTLEPFHETAYRHLMQAQVAAGNRAQALNTYQRLRQLLANELGADPSAPTEAVYLSLLRDV